MVKRESNLIINTPNIETEDEEGPLCYIKFLQGCGASICGGIVAGGARFCITIALECTTESHAFLKRVAEELPGGNDWVWLVMDKPSPCLPASAYFQPNMGSSRSAKALGFEVLLTQQYYLQRWAYIFQLMEE